MSVDMVKGRYLMRKLAVHRTIVDRSFTDLEPMTKSQIVEYASSLGVTLSMSLSKAVMISTLKATQEFTDAEDQRKLLDKMEGAWSPLL